jgi:hypothetical protein
VECTLQRVSTLERDNSQQSVVCSTKPCKKRKCRGPVSTSLCWATGAPLQPEHPCSQKGRWRRGANGGAAAVAADLPAFLSSPLLQMLQGLLLFRLCLPSTSPLQLGAGIHVCWCCALASASAGVHACLCKGMRACSWSTVQCCHVHVVHACLLVLQRACCACLHNSPSVDTSSRMRTS